jgi:hypothetical protein
MIYAILVLGILVNSYNYNSKPVTWDTIINKDIDLVNGWFSVEDCDKIMYATEKVNIRVSPKVGTTKIGFLNKNEAIHVIGICDNGWSKVLYNESTAYISSNYLSPNKVAVASDQNKVSEAKKPEPTKVEETSVKTYPSFVEEIGVSDDYVDKVLSNYYRIPEVARNKFEDFGGVLSITNENLGEKFFNDSSKHIVAVTSYKGSSKECSINIGTKDATSVLHEMGHFVDYVCGYLSDTEEYKGIWGSEVEAFKSFHYTADENTSTANEYFAESFQVYIESPNELQEKCPQSYGYIVNTLNHL